MQVASFEFLFSKFKLYYLLSIFPGFRWRRWNGWTERCRSLALSFSSPSSSCITSSASSLVSGHEGRMVEPRDAGRKLWVSLLQVQVVLPPQHLPWFQVTKVEWLNREMQVASFEFLFSKFKLYYLLSIFPCFRSRRWNGWTERCRSLALSFSSPSSSCITSSASSLVSGHEGGMVESRDAGRKLWVSLLQVQVVLPPQHIPWFQVTKVEWLNREMQVASFEFLFSKFKLYYLLSIFPGFQHENSIYGSLLG